MPVEEDLDRGDKQHTIRLSITANTTSLRPRYGECCLQQLLANVNGFYNRIVRNGSIEILYVKGLCKQQSSTNVSHHHIVLSFDFIKFLFGYIF